MWEGRVERSCGGFVERSRRRRLSQWSDARALLAVYAMPKRGAWRRACKLSAWRAIERGARTIERSATIGRGARVVARRRTSLGCGRLPEAAMVRAGASSGCRRLLETAVVRLATVIGARVPRANLQCRRRRARRRRSRRGGNERADPLESDPPLHEESGVGGRGQRRLHGRLSIMRRRATSQRLK